VTATRTETSAPRPAGGGGRGWLPARFTREVIAELRKVLRPSRKELLTYTAVVIVFVVVMVSIVAGLDIGFAKLILEVFG
jgi:preprotein translocase subunit SecE